VPICHKSLPVRKLWISSGDGSAANFSRVGNALALHAVMLRVSQNGTETTRPALSELVFVDHVRNLDPLKRCSGRMERAKALDRACQSLDRAVILFNDIVQILRLSDVGGPTITSEFPDHIDGSDLGLTGTSFVD